MRGFSEECCDMRGLLGFLVLFLVSKKPMHGQEIASELAKRRVRNRAPGTIYPALKGLKDAGFLREEKEGALELAKKRFTRTFFGVNQMKSIPRFKNIGIWYF